MTDELTEEQKQKLKEAEEIKKAVEKNPKKKPQEPIVGCSRPPMTEETI